MIKMNLKKGGVLKFSHFRSRPRASVRSDWLSILISHFRVVKSVDGYTGKVVLTDRLLRHTTAGYSINVTVSDGWNTVGPSTIDVTIISKIISRKSMIIKKKTRDMWL